jgi:hypothetical protein
MKNLPNRKLFELFELFDKIVINYSLFDKLINPSLLLPLKVVDEASESPLTVFCLLSLDLLGAWLCL